jgi:hypothetical protein
VAGLREVLFRVILRDARRPPSLAHQLLPDAPDLQAATVAANLDEDGNVWRLVTVDGPAGQLARLRAALARPLSNLLDHKVLGGTRTRLVLWYGYAPRHVARGPSLTAFALRTLGTQAILTDRTTPEGLEVRILAPEGPRLARFLERIEGQASADHDYSLLYVGPPRSFGDAHLTAEEERALLEAQAMGLFRTPRKGSVRALAAKLGCSPSAAGARLRRAEGKLAERYAAWR